MRRPLSSRLAPMQADAEPEPQPSIPPIAVDLETAARSIGLCMESYRTGFNAGKLPGTRIGGRIVVNLRALDAFTFAACMQHVKAGPELAGQVDPEADGGKAGT